MSELIAYSELHPLSPGQERMLAKLTHMVAIGAQVQVDGEPIPLSDHFIRKFPDEI
ncbi:hypothetical protein IM816_05875 [Luteibacter flocculans]|uniref:Uncharacterized protein n=1 Tax=Luteibacter flocculans TaxID=2780091 RepID=A0ABY4T410_9GAMM|nr:hypothetical protein [Luteibacter flocculans]URL59624.1 hypothetical protein IM816_05875 [Luteibacter flocculans]